MENLIKRDDLGGNPPIFGNTHMTFEAPDITTLELTPWTKSCFFRYMEGELGAGWGGMDVWMLRHFRWENRQKPKQPWFFQFGCWIDDKGCPYTIPYVLKAPFGICWTEKNTSYHMYIYVIICFSRSTNLPKRKRRQVWSCFTLFRIMLVVSNVLFVVIVHQYFNKRFSCWPIFSTISKVSNETGVYTWFSPSVVVLGAEKESKIIRPCQTKLFGTTGGGQMIRHHHLERVNVQKEWCLLCLWLSWFVGSCLHI